MRVSRTGHRSGRCWVLWIAGSGPRRVVQVVGFGDAGKGAGDVFGGGRSYGFERGEATENGRDG